MNTQTQPQATINASLLSMVKKSMGKNFDNYTYKISNGAIVCKPKSNILDLVEAQNKKSIQSPTSMCIDRECGAV